MSMQGMGMPMSGMMRFWYLFVSPAPYRIPTPHPVKRISTRRDGIDSLLPDISGHGTGRQAVGSYTEIFHRLCCQFEFRFPH